MPKKLEKLYYKSIDKDSAKDLEEINKLINKWTKNIENKLGFTFYETSAINMPHEKFDVRDIKAIKSASETVVLRDKEGFYGIDQNVQNRLNEVQMELEILHNLILRKEAIMNIDNVAIKPNITKEELNFVSEQLGYGKIRDDILENQSRDKKVK